MSRKKVPGVYVIADLTDSMAYVGSSVDLEGRLKRHDYTLRHDTHSNFQLQRAHNRGNELVAIPIPLKSGESTLEVEQHILDEFKGQGVLYNLAPDATAPMLGVKQSPETIEKRRQSRLVSGYRHSEETRLKMSVNSIGKNLGKVRTDEFKAAVGDRFRGVPLSDEHKVKLSEHFKGYDFGPEHRQKQLDKGLLEGRPVVCDGVRYPGLRTAARELGLPRNTIKGRIDSTSDKFPDWQYVTDDPKDK